MEHTYDLSQVPDIGYDNFASYVEGKYGTHERKWLDEIVGAKSRITVFVYKDRIECAFSPYSLPRTQEGLQEVFYPTVTEEQMQELRSETNAYSIAQEILKSLKN